MNPCFVPDPASSNLWIFCRFVLPHAFTGPRFLSLGSRSHSLAVSLEFILTLSQRALFVFSLSLSAGPPLFYLPHVSPSLLVLLTLPLPLSSSPSYSAFLVFMSASRIQVFLGIFKFRIFYICFSTKYSAILFLIFHVLSICTVVISFCASCLLLFFFTLAS